MKPILVDFGPFSIHAYGLGLALGFLLGSGWVLRRGPARGYPEDDLMRLFWWILLSALIGARLYYVLQHPEDFENDVLGVFQLWHGGLTQYGGVIAAVLVGGLFIRSRGWSFLAVSDLLAPGLALGEAITRIGCFFNGCCFGKPAAHALTVHYPPGSHAHSVLGTSGVHPSQLYLSGANLLLFVLLVRCADRMPRTGRLFALFLAGSGGIRFLIDFTRYYTPQDQIVLDGLHWAHSQWVSLAFVAAAVLLWVRAPRPQSRQP